MQKNVGGTYGADILLDFIRLLYYTTYEYTTHK